MCSGIAFIIGLFLLFRGQVRVANRTIPAQQSRIIALILMAPPVIAFCAAGFILAPGGDITYDQFLQVGFVEIGALVIAVGLVIYNILSIPQTPDNTIPQPMPVMRPQEPPSVMTVAEAATYLRVTEAEVMNLINQGKLAAARIGDSYRIARIAIDDYIAQR